MFKYLHKIKDYFLIKQSGLFDEGYYCLQYPDIRRADVDPLWHFVNSGWRENRNPNPSFVTNYYIAMNPDVLKSRVNPLVHYVLFGKDEGRLTNSKTLTKELSVIEVSTIEKILTPTQVINNPKKTHALVDIVVCVYDAKEYIQTCLDSILQNTAFP
jgi:hypothetical protein